MSQQFVEHMRQIKRKRETANGREKTAALNLQGEVWHRWRGVEVMGGATLFPRHIFHMHRNYSDTMAALQTSPYLTCLFFFFILQYEETETQQLGSSG